MQLTATHIGGPTAIVETDGIRFITDPTFDPGGGEYPSGPATLKKVTGPALSPEALGNIDFVLLSHEHHWDNFDHSGRTFAAKAQQVITTVEGARKIGANAVGLVPWQTHVVTRPNRTGISVTATPARHGPAHSDRGPVVGFVLRLDGSDETIYFSGDTVWYEGVEEVSQRFSNVRVAILNLGAASVPQIGPFHLTFTAAEAVNVGRAFPHARIVPLHYEGWEHFREHRPEIEAAFRAAGLQDRLSWLEPGRAIHIQV